MMSETLDYECTPSNEPCAQLGETNYAHRARLEAMCLIDQLRRENGPEPDRARFRIVRNSHDFGTYLSLAIEFDPDDDSAFQWAYSVDQAWPDQWDEEARAALTAGGYYD